MAKKYPAFYGFLTFMISVHKSPLLDRIFLQLRLVYIYYSLCVLYAKVNFLTKSIKYSSLLFPNCSQPLVLLQQLRSPSCCDTDVPIAPRKA
jgi:hypothetical protein